MTEGIEQTYKCVFFKGVCIFPIDTPMPYPDTDTIEEVNLKELESKENLVVNDVESCKTDPILTLENEVEFTLSNLEKKFLLSAERGDIPSVKRQIAENKDNPEFNINCTDPVGRSALIAAIENENIDLIQLLLEAGIQVKDALLHAISEEYVDGVETLLYFEEDHHEPGAPYSWESVDCHSSSFTPDITPLILAAHRNHYEILKILLDRGATLPMPHDVRCGCDFCITSSKTDSLRHSQSRINAYRALSSSSLIALTSRDPVLTAFELSWELRRLSIAETEFRKEYMEMRENVQQFASSLLDHSRTSAELEVLLNHNHEESFSVWEPGERQTLERLKLAIKYKQKDFVAHPNVQQLLAAIWYAGLPGFRRKKISGQLVQIGKLGIMFPFYSMIYIFSPTSEMGKYMKNPFVKFIFHSTSYMFFLMLLGAASQRFEYLILELIGTDWFMEILANWRRYERGSLPGPTEMLIMLYVFSYIWAEIRALWSGGLIEYISDLWNIIDFTSNTFYITWIGLRCTAFYIVIRDSWAGKDPYYPREQWHPFDPMLISEGVFAAGMIFSFLKLVYIFSISPHLGPLQVSLGRMIIDIIKFFFIYTLVLFAFGCGLNQLLWYYADLEKEKCYHDHPDIPNFDDYERACTIWRRFANLFETSQSLFWASFGLVDLMAFELEGIKSFTRFWAMLMFGSYSVINVIVLLNMLIAMMSNSYMTISERSDTEWKFARTKLWLSYFEDGDTVPPPFNLCPTVKLLNIGKSKRSNKSFIMRSKEKAQKRHDNVMKLLVRRYVTAEQRKRDDFGVTEDDVMEIRQDISTLRFELIDIFNGNGMKTPDIDKNAASSFANKKGKVMERRILKDFQIGIIDTAAAETKSTKNVFDAIAKAVAARRRSSEKGLKKEDWNDIVKVNMTQSDPIGSSRESMKRRDSRSLRRKIIDDANRGLEINTNELLAYNPKLTEVTPTTRTAYVKFMRKAKDDGTSDRPPAVTFDSNTKDDTTSSTTTPNVTVVNEKLSNIAKAMSLKKSSEPPADPGKRKSSMKPEAPPVPKDTAAKPTTTGAAPATTSTTTSTTTATAAKATAAATTTTTAAKTTATIVGATSITAVSATAASTTAVGSVNSTVTTTTTTVKADVTAVKSEVKTTVSDKDKDKDKEPKKTDDKNKEKVVEKDGNKTKEQTPVVPQIVPTQERGKSTVTGKTVSGWI